MEPEQLLKVQVHALNGMETVAAFHVSAPAFIGSANIRERKDFADELTADLHDSADFVPEFELLELAPHFLNGLIAHLAKDLPGLSQLETNLQELEALTEPLDLRLLRVQNDTERRADFLHLHETLLQVLFARVNQITVVHVPCVALNAELFLYKVIELVRQHERSSLGDLTSQAVPDRTEVIKALICEGPDLYVMNPLCEFSADRPVLGVRKVVREVKEQDIPVLAVLPVVPLQVTGKTVEGEVDTFVLRARAVVVDERGLERRVDHLVAECSLDYAFADMNTPDVPHFPSVPEVELDKASAFIGPVEKRAARSSRIRNQVKAVHLSRAFPANPAAADMAGLI